MLKTTKRPHNTYGLMQRAILKHIKGNDLKVYADLLTYADKFGKCYPSVETIAKDTGISSRNVQKHLANLEKEGWIEKHFRTNTSTNYQLYFVDTTGTPVKKAKRKYFGASKIDVPGVSKNDVSGASNIDVPGVSKLDVLTDHLTDQNNKPQEQSVAVVALPKLSTNDENKLTPELRIKFKNLWKTNSQDGESQSSALSAWTKYCSYDDPVLLRRIGNCLDVSTGTYMTTQMKHITEEYFDEKERKKRTEKRKTEGKVKSL